MDDTAGNAHHNGIRILSEIPNNSECKLVDIIVNDSHPQREHGPGRWGRRWHRKESGMTQHRGRRPNRHRIMRRLLDLGITTGCTFTVIHGGNKGPVLVQVRGTRVALGQGLARKMLVQVVN